MKTVEHQLLSQKPVRGTEMDDSPAILLSEEFVRIVGFYLAVFGAAPFS